MKIEKILALETSNELCSASLAFSKSSFDERNILLKHVHSEKLIPVIDDLFRSNDFQKNDLDCIAVSMGPGSFTGLRIGLTVAKGMAFSLGLPIVPVPTFESLAYEIISYLPINTNFCIINNANREECYCAEFSYSSNGLKIIRDVSLISKSDIEEYITGKDLIFGNYIGINSIKPIAYPRASSLANWTYLFGEDLLTFEYDYLEPKYLKNFKAKGKK
jgi:tRNA threonylcarbamoyladenosine biosynthesis protein TsaB